MDMFVGYMNKPTPEYQLTSHSYQCLNEVGYIPGVFREFWAIHGY